MSFQRQQAFQINSCKPFTVERSWGIVSCELAAVKKAAAHYYVALSI